MCGLTWRGSRTFTIKAEKTNRHTTTTNKRKQMHSGRRTRRSIKSITHSHTPAAVYGDCILLLRVLCILLIVFCALVLFMYIMKRSILGSSRLRRSSTSSDLYLAPEKDLPPPPTFENLLPHVMLPPHPYPTPVTCRDKHVAIPGLALRPSDCIACSRGLMPVPSEYRHILGNVWDEPKPDDRSNPLSPETTIEEEIFYLHQ